MVNLDNLAKFANLTFEDFRRLALDPSLSRYEKIGFPDEYRQGLEFLIFGDIRRKLPALESSQKKIADIGPGCSDLPLMIADICERRRHQLTWIDSSEMLAHLPDAPYIHKYPGRFPSACSDLLKEEAGTFDAVLAYSIFHYVMAAGDIFHFLDAALTLLASGGALLIGDIPNVSMRKRFFSSNTGRHYHHEFMGTQDDPVVEFNVLEPDKIDDAVIFSLLMRARAAGFHAFVVPQEDALPMANRREDLLIVRP